MIAPPLKYIWETDINETKATDLCGAGQVRHSEYGKFYRWVKNNDVVTLVKGQTACYDVSLSGATVVQNIKAVTTAGLPMFAGIVCADAGIKPGEYGWVQTYGENNIALVLGPATAGGTAGTVGRFYKPVNAQPYLADDGTTPTQPRCAQLMLALATVTTPVAGANKVYVRAL